MSYFYIVIWRVLGIHMHKLQLIFSISKFKYHIGFCDIMVDVTWFAAYREIDSWHLVVYIGCMPVLMLHVLNAAKDHAILNIARDCCLLKSFQLCSLHDSSQPKGMVYAWSAIYH